MSAPPSVVTVTPDESGRSDRSRSNAPVSERYTAPFSVATMSPSRRTGVLTTTTLVPVSAGTGLLM
nr:hypothetical protein QSJ49_07880 [Halobacterium salinarum]